MIDQDEPTAGSQKWAQKQIAPWSAIKVMIVILGISLVFVVGYCALRRKPTAKTTGLPISSPQPSPTAVQVHMPKVENVDDYLFLDLDGDGEDELALIGRVPEVQVESQWGPLPGTFIKIFRRDAHQGWQPVLETRPRGGFSPESLVGLIPYRQRIFPNDTDQTTHGFFGKVADAQDPRREYLVVVLGSATAAVAGDYFWFIFGWDDQAAAVLSLDTSVIVAEEFEAFPASGRGPQVEIVNDNTIKHHFDYFTACLIQEDKYPAGTCPSEPPEAFYWQITNNQLNLRHFQ